MADIMLDTVKQLFNLVWFCKKVNIPFEVYAFSSEYKIDRYTKNSGERTFKYKSGNGIMSDVRLICLANSNCKKKGKALKIENNPHEKGEEIHKRRNIFGD